MRYERKYLVEKNNSLVFKQFLIRNNFKSVYEKRKVNSIYFDTNDFKFYEENINGISRRKKVRLRWYNNQFKKPTVEIKIPNAPAIKFFIGVPSPIDASIVNPNMAKAKYSGCPNS